jgi:hypothetical protein
MRKNICPTVLIKVPFTFNIFHTLHPNENWPDDKKKLKTLLIKEITLKMI